MYKVGDEIDGYCSHCRQNTYQTVAAAEGEQVLSVTCRTCRNTDKHRPEVSGDQKREAAWKKLVTTQKRKPSLPRRTPVVVQRGRRVRGEDEGDEESATSAVVVRSGGRQSTEVVARATAATKAKVLSDSAVRVGERSEARRRWQELTSEFSARDGAPYRPFNNYVEGDVVLHKRHGMGVVQTILHEQACMALFREGEQVLQMGLTREEYYDTLM